MRTIIKENGYFTAKGTVPIHNLQLGLTQGIQPTHSIRYVARKST